MLQIVGGRICSVVSENKNQRDIFNPTNFLMRALIFHLREIILSAGPHEKWHSSTAEGPKGPN